MDNHPIPQDITGFQFKLIGNMTVKQFGYLAGGVLLAWVIYLFNIPFLIKLPLIIVFGSLGLIFAFVHVGGRPLDTMLGHLIKALVSPTQYIYQKEGGKLFKPQFSDTKQPNLQAHTASLPVPAAPPSTVAQLEQANVLQPTQPTLVTGPTPTSISPNFTGGVIDTSPAPNPTPPPMPEENSGKHQEEPRIEAEKIVEVEKKLEVQAQNLTEEIASTSASNPVKADELKAMLEETTRQKMELEKELEALRAKLNTAKPKPAPTEAPPPTPVASAFDAPNLIKGTIKDPRGNTLQNILVEVKDKEGNPVRAFKTNGPGQFASATSLSNGDYTVTFEDPKEDNRFDPVEIKTEGLVLPPLEITSIDSREELRRELFN